MAKLASDATGVFLQLPLTAPIIYFSGFLNPIHRRCWQTRPSRRHRQSIPSSLICTHLIRPPYSKLDPGSFNLHPASMVRYGSVMRCRFRGEWVWIPLQLRRSAVCRKMGSQYPAPETTAGAAARASMEMGEDGESQGRKVLSRSD